MKQPYNLPELEHSIRTRYLQLWVIIAFIAGFLGGSCLTGLGIWS